MDNLAKLQEILRLRRELVPIEEERTKWWRKASDLNSRIKQLEIELGMREQDARSLNDIDINTVYGLLEDALADSAHQEGR